MKEQMEYERSDGEMNNHNAVVTETTALCFQIVTKSDSVSIIITIIKMSFGVSWLLMD